MKCYKCETELPAGNLSYFCNQQCKEAYWSSKPTPVKKYDSVKSIQDRCRILVEEMRKNKSQPSYESAPAIFDGGLF